MKLHLLRCAKSKTGVATFDGDASGTNRRTQLSMIHIRNLQAVGCSMLKMRGQPMLSGSRRQLQHGGFSLRIHA